MSTEEPNAAATSATPDQTRRATRRFNTIAVILISIVTVISAAAAFLQNNAANRQNVATRDMQRYAAAQLSAALQSLQQQNYDSFIYQSWSGLSWERSLLLNSNFVTDTARADQLADLMKLTTGFSPLLQTPYLSDPIQGSPDLAQYYAAKEYDPTYWQQLRDAAAAANSAWSAKASTYVSVLTLFAVALFLFGIAATIGGKLRGGFAALGVLIAIVATGWMTATALSPVNTRSEAAMQAMARGHVDVYRASILRDWREKDAALQYFQSGINQLNDALRADPAYAEALSERASAYLQAGEQRVWDREDGSQFLQYAIDDYRAAIGHGDESLNALWNLGWAYFLLGDQPESLDWTDRALEKAPQQIGLYLNQALALRALGKVNEAFAAVDQAYQQAKTQPISSANYYFHASIFDITQQLRAFPNPDLAALLKDVKEKYVSLRYRKGQPAQPSGGQITAVTFYQTLNENKVLIDPTDTFPAQTEGVYAGFDYTHMPASGEIEALVYFEDREDETLTVLEKLSDFTTQGTGYVHIVSPFISSGGLASGKYRVDIHINGEWLASGEFTVK